MGHACPGVPGPPQSPGPRPSRARARCARGSSGFGRARRARRWQSPCTLRRQPPKVWTRPMSCVLEHHERERWGLILAGGEGIRLRPLTQALYGDERPKQFCALLGRETLLERTRRRAALVIPPGRVLVSLTRGHERFWSPLLGGMPPPCALVQPAGRGTAPPALPRLPPAPGAG